MSKDFEQINFEPFMKHNGGLLFRTISENESEFKTTIKENHLNAAGITHGGFISAIVDTGLSAVAYKASGNSSCATISLEIKFIAAVKLGEELFGKAKIQKRTKSMIFLTCELTAANQIVATGSSLLKILNKKIAKTGTDV
ncbi:MAG: PaaI family thioesterase [Candidatus Pelagibacterales bacterium]|nr:MAG: PaaI family thioesterase [Pelagibacterales bacterium]